MALFFSSSVWERIGDGGVFSSDADWACDAGGFGGVTSSIDGDGSRKRGWRGKASCPLLRELERFRQINFCCG